MNKVLFYTFIEGKVVYVVVYTEIDGDYVIQFSPNKKRALHFPSNHKLNNTFMHEEFVPPVKHWYVKYTFEGQTYVYAKGQGDGTVEYESDYLKKNGFESYEEAFNMYARFVKSSSFKYVRNNVEFFEVIK